MKSPTDISERTRFDGHFTHVKCSLATFRFSHIGVIGGRGLGRVSTSIRHGIHSA